MSKSMIYAVYDAKVKYYHTPGFMRNRGEALRSWETIANDGKSQISSHPSDFDLHELAEFDENTGKITPLISPESLGLAIHYKRTPSHPTPLFPEQKVND